MADPVCPRRNDYEHRKHDVRLVGGFGGGLGVGYECHTCWLRFRIVGGRVVLGWPAPDLTAIDTEEDP